MSLFLSLWMQLFFVLTPFFSLTMFLALTENEDEPRRKKIAIGASAAVAITGLILFFAGKQLFSMFGITLDAFRIGAGSLLFLSAISLAQGRPAGANASADGEITVVPLAIPIIVGPATTGTLLVLGAELQSAASKAVGSLALLSAVLCLGGILLAGSAIKKRMGSRGIAILSRLTGMILSALAAQMIMTGILSFLRTTY